MQTKTYKGKSKINSATELPPLLIEPRTSWSSHQCSADWAKSTFGYQSESLRPFIKLCSIGSRKDRSPKCEVVHKTKFTAKNCWPTHTWPAQSVEHWSDDQELLGFIPNQGQFFGLILFCFTPCKLLLPTLYNLGKTWLIYIELKFLTLMSISSQKIASQVLIAIELVVGRTQCMS